MEKETRYGIRKLSVGVASVAVGTVVAGAEVVHAEEAEIPVDQSENTSEITDEVTVEAEALSQLQFVEENQNEESTENVNVYSGGGKSDSGKNDLTPEKLQEQTSLLESEENLQDDSQKKTLNYTNIHNLIHNDSLDMSDDESDELDISEAIQARAALQSRAASEKLTPEQIRGLQDCVAEFKDNYLVIRPKDITKPGAISIERLESYNALREKLTSKEAEGKELKCEGKIYCYGGLGGKYGNSNTGLFSDSKLTGGIEALANWDVSEVTSMWALFRESSFTGKLTPLAKWDTSNVTNMGGMFEKSQLTGDLTPLANWKTYNVTNMWAIFYEVKLTGDLTPLENWDTSQVTNMRGMFVRSQLKGDLTPLANWDTSNVTNIGHMFDGSKFIGDFRPLASWDLSKVGRTLNMFNGVGNSNTSLILNGLNFANSGEKRDEFSGFKGVVVANGWKNITPEQIDKMHNFNNPTMLLVTDNETIYNHLKDKKFSKQITLNYSGKTFTLDVPVVYDSRGAKDPNNAMEIVKAKLDKLIKAEIEKQKNEGHSGLNGKYIPSRGMNFEEEATQTPMYLIQQYELNPDTTTKIEYSRNSEAFKTIIEYDPTMEKGKIRTKREGKSGIRLSEIEITLLGDKEISRRVVRTSLPIIPVDRIIAVGTNEQTVIDEKYIEAVGFVQKGNVTYNPLGYVVDMIESQNIESVTFNVFKAGDVNKSSIESGKGNFFRLNSDKYVNGDYTVEVVITDRNKESYTFTKSFTYDMDLNKGPQGEPGPAGPQGPKGEDGKSITKAEVDTNGNLWITIKGQEKPIKVGKVKGENGKTPEIIVGDKVNGVTKITIKGYNEKGEPLEDKVIEIKDGITYIPVVSEKDEQNGVTTIKFYPAKPGTTEADKNADPIGNEIKIYDGLSPLVDAGRNETDDGLTLTITTLTRNDEGKVVKTPKEFNIKDGKNGITPKIMARREKDKNGRTGIAIYACYPKKEEQLLSKTRAILLSSDDEFYDTPPTLDHMLPPMAMTARSVVLDSEDEWHQTLAKSAPQVNQDRDKKSPLGGQINTLHEQTERDRKGNSTRSADKKLAAKPSTSVSLITQPKTKSKTNEVDSISPARRDKKVIENSNLLKEQKEIQATDSIALGEESKKGIANSDSLTRESKKVADTHSLPKESKKAVADAHSLTKENKKDIADSNSFTKETKKVTTADSSLEKKVSQAKDSSVDKMYQLWKENPENEGKSINEFVTEVKESQQPAENIQVAKLATGIPSSQSFKRLPQTGSAVGFASFAGMNLLLAGASLAKKKAETDQ